MSPPSAPELPPSAPSLDLRALAPLVVLIVGASFVLVRSDAVHGYGPFAPALAAAVWIGVWTLAALGCGRPLTRILNAGTDASWESEVMAAIAGSAVLVGCAAVLSTVHLFRPWPLLMALLALALAGVVDVVRHPLPWPAIELRFGPLLGLGAVAVLIATSVSPFYDQWHQHLGFPWVWLQGGTIRALPHDWYSFMPVNSSLLFAYGLGTLGQWSAQLVHWWCGVVAVLATGALARRTVGGSAAIWTVWIVATTPVVLHLATTAGSDLVLAMFAAGAWLALSRTVAEGDGPLRWWIATGVCVGLAVGTKYIALGTVAIPIAFGAVVLHRPWRRDVEGRRFVPHAALAAVTAAVTFSPWAVRNFWATGNPLFPFANRLFASTLRAPFEVAGGFSTTLSGLDPSIGHLVRGLDLASFTASIDGFPSIGFLYIALVALPVVAWPRLRRRPGMPALAAGTVAGVGFWLVTMHVSRYLVPVLVPMSVLLGAALGDLTNRLSAGLRASVGVLVGWLVALTLAGSMTPIGMERLGAALGVVSIDPLLARWVSSMPSLEAVASLDDDAVVLLVAEARALGFERPVLFSDPYRDPLLLDLVRSSASREQLVDTLTAAGVTHVLANRWEAVRSSRLRGNERFFVVADPRVEGLLADFCSRCLDPVWTAPGLVLYRLVPACDAPAPGGADLATW